MDAIPVVDLRFLTQAEINTLALSSSSSSSTPSRCDDVVVPKIDRSVFNESAGSRKQTYSRLRLAPPKRQIPSPSSSTTSSSAPPLPRRRGRPRSNPLPPVDTAPPPSDELGKKENVQIIRFLRQLFATNQTSEADSVPTNPISATIEPKAHIFNPDASTKLASVDKPHIKLISPVAAGSDQGTYCSKERKKRGRKKRTAVEAGVGASLVAEERDHELLSVTGVEIDLLALGEKEDFFREELRNKTAGMVTETEFLEFLNSLEGEWGSRRKRRKIVDASLFGNGLPKGWKLLLGLKRKDNTVGLHCRRYISLSGKQFVTCKEISSYLLSIVGPKVVERSNNVQQDVRTTIYDPSPSGCVAECSQQLEIRTETSTCCPEVPHSISAEFQNQLTSPKVENPAKIQLLNLLECRKCHIKFPEKNALVQHSLEYHPRSAKRCRLGKSISSGVIIKNGLFECQFCHKTFTERHRYTGHVGIHVRNYSQSLESLPDETITGDKLEESSTTSFPSTFSEHVNVAADNKEDNVAHDACTSNPLCDFGSYALHSAENIEIGDADCDSNGRASATSGEGFSSVTNNGHHTKHDETGDRLRKVTQSSGSLDAEPNTFCNTDSYLRNSSSEVNCQKNECRAPVWALQASSRSTNDSHGNENEFGTINTIVAEANKLLNVDNQSYAPESTSRPPDVESNDAHFSSCNMTDENRRTDSDDEMGEDNKILAESACDSKSNDAEITVEDSRNISSVEYLNNNDVNIEESRNDICMAIYNVSRSIDETSVGISLDKQTCIKVDRNNRIATESHRESLDALNVACNSDSAAIELNCAPQSVMSIRCQNSGQNRICNMDNDNLNFNPASCALGSRNVSFRSAENAIRSTCTEKGFLVSTIGDEADGKISEEKIDPKCHSPNLPCSWQTSNEDAFFPYRRFDEIGQSLCDQQLCLESNMSSLPMDAQSYSEQPYMNDVLVTTVGRQGLANIDGYIHKQETGSENKLIVNKGNFINNSLPDIGSFCNGQEGDTQNRVVFSSVAKNYIDDMRSSNTQDSVLHGMIESCSRLKSSVGFDKDFARDGTPIGGSSVHCISAPWEQPSSNLTADFLMRDEGMHGGHMYCMDQKQGCMSGFEEVRFDNYQSSNSVMFINENQRPSEEPVDYAYNAPLNNAFVPPIQLEWEITGPNTVSRQHLVTTVCMWCGAQFSQDGINLQIQPDSAGSICSSCKEKIQLKF